MTLRTNPGAFVNFIASKFDARHYPGVPTKDITLLPNERDPFIRGITNLPVIPQKTIYNNGVNISEWFALTRFVHRSKDPSSHMRGAIEWSAQDRLKSLGQNRDHFRSATDQLVTFVFQDVYNHATSDEKDRLIELTSPFNPLLDSFSFKFRRSLYKVHGYTSWFFSNTIVRYAISGVAVIATYRFYGFAKGMATDALVNHIIPRSALFLMARAPLPLIRVIDKSIRYFDYLVKKQWMIWLSFVAVQWILPGQARPVVNRAYRVILFPVNATQYLTEIPGKILWWGIGRTFSLSWQTQNSIAVSLQTLHDQKKARYYEEQGIRTFQLWKAVMDNKKGTLWRHPS